VTSQTLDPVADPLNPGFNSRVDELLRDLVGRLDEFDPDELEAERAEGVLRLTFADGSKCILNRQSAAGQVWLAEGATAWHFTWDDAAQQWVDTKGRGGLRPILREIIVRKLGRQVAL